MVGGRKLIALAGALALASCSDPGRVDPRDYDAFWLWAGVEPQPVLQEARIIYLLDGEVRAGEGARYVALRPEPPRLPGKQVWLVVRADTLRWPESAYGTVGRRLAQWRAAGSDLQGLQLDFDARTRHLEEYAAFLQGLRNRLPAGYRLSVTGLLDWSANGDPEGLRALEGVVDEVVLQIYQGRRVIPGYARYLQRLDRLNVPFRIGLLQDGEWTPPPSLAAHPKFRGYVVFLLNPR